jgi:hypothetical protein
MVGPLEPSFFSHRFERESEKEPIAGQEWYESLFDNWSGQTAVGEKSVGYLTSQHAPERIRETLGEHVKLIASLRNPVDRAYSSYRMHQSHGRVTVNVDFHRFLSRNRFRVKSNSQYSANLRRYLAHFPRENMRILLYEELRQDSRAQISACLDWLGVDPHFVAPTLNAPVNKGKDVSVLPRRVWNLHRATKWHLPPAVAKSLSAAGNYVVKWLPKAKQFEPLSEHVRQELMGEFMPDIEQLEDLLGRDLSIWYTPAPPHKNERSPDLRTRPVRPTTPSTNAGSGN